MGNLLQTFFTNVFYLIGIMYVFYEFADSFSYIYGNKIKELQEFERLTSLEEDTLYKDRSDEFKKSLKKRMPSAFLLFWIFLGLMTAQWPLFLFLILFNSLLVGWFTRPIRYNKAYAIIHSINSVFCALIGLFIVINHYHLHIDLYDFIKNNLV